MNAIATPIAAGAAKPPPPDPIVIPRLYKIPPAIYHADPCVIPSLSCSIAKKLRPQGGTPRHAWQAHARFGAVETDPTRAMDDGSTLHAMMLGDAHLIQPITAVYGPKHKKAGQPVTDFMTDTAKEERDEIRKMGFIPVLQHRLTELIRCKTLATRQLADAEDSAIFLELGGNEVCAVSVEDDVYLRCLVDRLPDDPRAAPGDLKCTEMSATPGGWERRLRDEYAFQAAFYRRVLRGAEGFERPAMRFGVIELDPPHGSVIMAPTDELMAIADAEVERAIQIWRQCMLTNVWPCYGRETVHVGPTAWQLSQANDNEQPDPRAIAAHVGAPATLSAVRALSAA